MASPWMMFLAPFSPALTSAVEITSVIDAPSFGPVDLDCAVLVAFDFARDFFWAVFFCDFRSASAWTGSPSWSLG